MDLLSHGTTVLILITHSPGDFWWSPVHEEMTHFLRHGHIVFMRIAWYLSSSPQKTAQPTSHHMEWQTRFAPGALQGHQVVRELRAGKAWSGHGRCNLEERPWSPLAGSGEGKEGQSQHPPRKSIGDGLSAESKGKRISREHWAGKPKA